MNSSFFARAPPQQQSITEAKSIQQTKIKKKGDSQHLFCDVHFRAVFAWVFSSVFAQNVQNNRGMGCLTL